jgi:hypothetical protein
VSCRRIRVAVRALRSEASRPMQNSRRRFGEMSPSGRDVAGALEMRRKPRQMIHLPDLRRTQCRSRRQDTTQVREMSASGLEAVAARRETAAQRTEMIHLLDLRRTRRRSAPRTPQGGGDERISAARCRRLLARAARQESRPRRAAGHASCSFRSRTSTATLPRESRRSTMSPTSSSADDRTAWPSFRATA